MLHPGTGTEGWIKTIANHWLSCKDVDDFPPQKQKNSYNLPLASFSRVGFGQPNHNNKRFDSGLIAVRASRRHGCQAYYFAERRDDDFLESHCYSNTIIRRECFSPSLSVLSRPESDSAIPPKIPSKRQATHRNEKQGDRMYKVGGDDARPSS